MSITHGGLIYADQEAPPHVLLAEVERLRAGRLAERNDGRREERVRIRREILGEFGEPGPVEWRELMKVLDRLEEG
jgi:hypothetical protein